MTSTMQQRLAQAEQLCRIKGARLTPVRKKILEMIYEHGPAEQLTAYELLRRLRLSQPTAEAMTIYRGLDFLQQQGFIHRIATQNAYVVCDMPQHQHLTQLLLCEKCGQAQEIHALPLIKTIKQTLKEHDFYLSDEKPLEILGLCKSCFDLAKP